MEIIVDYGLRDIVAERYDGSRRFDGGGDRRVQSLAHATALLIDAFSNAAETLRKRQKRKLSVYMRIEHVHVGHDGQAAIGNVQRAKPSDE